MARGGLAAEGHDGTSVGPQTGDPLLDRLPTRPTTSADDLSRALLLLRPSHSRLPAGHRPNTLPLHRLFELLHPHLSPPLRARLFPLHPHHLLGHLSDRLSTRLDSAFQTLDLPSAPRPSHPASTSSAARSVKAQPTLKTRMRDRPRRKRDSRPAALPTLKRRRRAQWPRTSQSKRLRVDCRPRQSFLSRP